MFDCQECVFKGVSSENLKEHVAENHIFGKLDKNINFNAKLINI